MPKARSASSAATAKLSALSQGKQFVQELIKKSTQPKARALTDFQVAVLAACSCVPKGFVATYGGIAQHCGHPGSSRAVGQALSQNPFAPTVPCHRVVGSNRFLVGFGGVAGVSSKKVALLKAEGVQTTEDGKVVPKFMIF